MPVVKKQSAIKEARDQLFLDTADGVRLNVVTSNLGLDRPLIGIDDDEWRSIAKSVALQPKVVRNVFARLMEICTGPKKTRIAALSADSAIGASIVQCSDASDLLQLGTLVFSPGQVIEESVSFCFRDLETNKVFLNGDLTQPHTLVDEASGHLLAATAAGAASLVLISTKTFPTTNYPYSLILARGTEAEETVVVTGNDPNTNTLTLLNVTVNDQAGPRATFVSKVLDADAPNGRVFIKLDDDATRPFPGQGFLRLDFNGANQETREYESNDVVADVLYLRRPLENDHVAGESVELVTPGATVETCSVIQVGVGWELFETEHRKIKVYAPSMNTDLRLRDASWMHGEVPAAFATTLASPAVSTDLILDVTDISGFPDEAGLILIDGTITRFYVLRDETGVQLHLTQELGFSKLAGTPVALIREVYPGTNLEQGNLTTNQFPGPYLYDATQRAPSTVNTQLDEAIPAPTRLAVAALAGQKCLEVLSAFTWPATPFTPFTLRLGRTTGGAEDLTINDRTLKGDAVTTVNIAPVPDPGALTIQGVDTTAFPQADGINIAGYRIIIDEGGGNEEILTVTQNSAAAPGNFTLLSPTTVVHAPGETIGLLNDILTVDPTVFAHAGPSLSPTVEGHRVEPLTTKIELLSGAAFPAGGGIVWLNFGKERPNIRRRIISVVSTTVLEFADTSVFPDAANPYAILVGEGLPHEEYATVITNDTGLNRLTLSAALVGTFNAGDYVEFYAGAPLTVSYVDRDTNTLDLAQPTVFLSGYTKGETVMLSPVESIPSEFGRDYAMLMPPDATICLTALFELVRAAGVEIEFLENT